MLDIEQTGPGGSWIWMDVVKCIESLRNGLCYKVGRNSKLRIWEDLWITNIPKFKPLTDDHWTPTTSFFVNDLMELEAPRWDK